MRTTQEGMRERMFLRKNISAAPEKPSEQMQAAAAAAAAQEEALAQALAALDQDAGMRVLFEGRVLLEEVPPPRCMSHSHSRMYTAHQGKHAEAQLNAPGASPAAHKNKEIHAARNQGAQELEPAHHHTLCISCFRPIPPLHPSPMHPSQTAPAHAPHQTAAKMRQHRQVWTPFLRAGTVRGVLHVQDAGERDQEQTQPRVASL